MWDVFGALFHNSVGVTRARQNPCLLAQGKWILVQGKEAEVDPDTIKMYTILVTSQFHISSLSEDSYLLSFTIRENGIQKKEIQASKNKLRANGPKPQLAPGTSSAFLFSSCPGDLHVVSIKMAEWWHVGMLYRSPVSHYPIWLSSFLFSLVALYYINKISSAKHTPPSKPVAVTPKTKKHWKDDCCSCDL